MLTSELLVGGVQVPVLLTGMVYSKAEQETFEADKQFQLDSVPDRPEDLRPRHYHSKHGTSTSSRQQPQGVDAGRGDGWPDRFTPQSRVLHL